jgi:hypothetical protein
MKITHTIHELEDQRNLLESYSQQRAAVTPRILCIGFLVLVTACSVEIKPDKVPGGVTGNNRPSPNYLVPTGPFYQDSIYPSPFPVGGYGPGYGPASTSTSNRPTGDGFTIKITSR